MRVAVVALTAQSAHLAATLASQLGADLHAQQSHLPSLATDGAVGYQLPLERHCQQLFADYQGLVFVMSVGIVVRCIAPLLRSKLVDPAVVVLDECGRHAISLLSGHLGGANQLARRVAVACGAQPVITTATDLHGLVAPDLLASRNRCLVENPPLIRQLNSALLQGQPLALFTPFPVAGDLPGEYQLNPGQPLAHNVVLDSRLHPVAGATLYLRPRHLALGVGCRRGVSARQLQTALEQLLTEHGLCGASIGWLASIELKADEPGLLEWAHQLQLPLGTYSAAELSAVAGVVSHSRYVQQVTGTPNVCEAAALLAAGPGAELLVPKTIAPGLTLAVAAAPYRVACGDEKESEVG